MPTPENSSTVTRKSPYLSEVTCNPPRVQFSRENRICHRIRRRRTLRRRARLYVLAIAGATGVSYVNPVPGGTVTPRTDQGVDISASPGTPIFAITAEKVMGILPNWYKGQPYVWFRQLGTNTYNYVAEQIIPSVKPGDIVQAGQRVGTVAPSGTGLEVGWATPSGETLARATTGYTEGQATPAGQSYREQVLQGNSSPQGNSSLAQLWIQAGGNPALANTMAAIAMAESTGQVGITHTNKNGTIDRGLWQINSAHTQFDTNRLVTDPLYNAQAAVAVEKSSGLNAWSTYRDQSYRTYLGKPDRIVGYGGSRPGGQPAGQSSSDVSTVFQQYTSLRDMPRTAPPGTANPWQWFQASFTGNWQNLGLPND